MRLNISKKSKGFTLLEILIVLVIIAVLAGLAIPAYQATVEKSRGQEALQFLTSTKESLLRYHAQFNTYVGACFASTGGCVAPNVLDFDPNAAGGTGQTLIFTYTLPTLTANNFVITATRAGGGPVGTISLNAAGTVTKTGAQA